jgi:hypothetical protein
MEKSKRKEKKTRQRNKGEPLQPVKESQKEIEL